MDASEPPRLLTEAIVDAMPEPLVVLNGELKVIEANRAFCIAFGLARHHVKGQRFRGVGNGGDFCKLESLLKDEPERRGAEAWEIEQELSGCGRRKLALNARRIFAQEYRGPLVLLTIVDITERRRNEEKAARLLTEKEILLVELRHRVANSLQIVASILSLKSQHVESAEIRIHLQEAHRRVLSVAAVQQQLRAVGLLEQIEVAPCLSRLCEALGTSLIGDAQPVVVRCLVGKGTATSSEAVSMGLIVTELVINALKHAFVDGRPEGHIDVSFEKVRENWRLAVSDDGVGQPVGQMITAGLGTSIVEALAQQLDARVETSMTSGGTTVSIVHGPPDRPSD